MATDIVFLNVYCRSLADEHKPRGPEGPFQFNDRSVPVLVIKDHTGKTLVQQLGWARTPSPERLAEILKNAHRKASPIKAPVKKEPAKKKSTKKAFSRPEKWFNAEGKSMIATFVGLFEKGEVVHFKKEGSLLKIPLSQLSKASQERVKKLTSKKEA